MSFYDQRNQKVFYAYESALGTPVNGAGAFTQLPVTFPWYGHIDVIPNSVDLVPPRLVQEKRYGIGSGKHPSHIFSTAYEAATITLETDAIFMPLFASAVGACVTTHTPSRAEVATITCVADVADSLDGTYFIIHSIDASANDIAYCVWIDVDDSGTADPTPTGCTSKEVTTIATNDDASTVAAAVEAVVETLDISSSAAAAVITATGDNDGAVVDVRDGAAATGFTFATTTQGCSTHTITEANTYVMKTFTLHVEWDNGSEDIAYDCFGCTVNSVTLTINPDTKIVKCTYEILTPYYVVGTISTNPPPKTPKESFVYGNLTEAASNYVLQLGTADRTPVAIENLELAINNNVQLKYDVGSKYAKHAYSTKREVTLNITGFAQTKELWDAWKDTWDNANEYYTNEGAKLNTVINLTRTATYDTFIIKISNWVIDEHSMAITNIDEGIKGIEVKLSDAIPDSNGRIISSFVIVNQISERMMHNA